MTAPFNPGGQPGYQPYGGVIPTQQPGFAPPPAYPQGPQQQPQYQQPVPQQQPYQQPYQQPALPQGTDVNTRIYGPQYPQELQGKTLGEAMRYYGIMREDFIRRNQQQPQPQQQPQQQPQFQQQPGQQPQPQGAGSMGQPSAQPRGQPDQMQQFVEDAVRKVMPEVLAPITRPMQQDQLARVYGSVKAQYPDWNQYEGDILQSLQGADPATLQNPAVWDAAYKFAVGNAAVRSRQGQQQPQGQPQFQPLPYGTPTQQMPPMPPQQGYGPPMPYAPQGAGGSPAFVESPTPPPPGYNPQAQDPRDEVFAQRFNVPVEVYRSWKGGRVGMMGRSQDVAPQNPWGGPPNMPQPQYQPPQQQGYQPQNFGQPAQPQVPPGYYLPGQMNGAGYGR